MALLALGSVVALALLLPNLFWEQKIYVYMGSDRVPAAIDRSLNFTHLDGRDLRVTSERRLAQAARLMLGPGGLELELGNYALKKEDGEAAFSCQVYDRIEVVFRAVGVAESGRIPSMTVEGACRLSLDYSRIQPLWVPLAEIFQEPHGDGEFTFMGGDEPVTVRFEGVGSFWPQEWEVESFRHFKSGLYHQGIVVSSEALHRYRAQPLKVDWAQLSSSGPNY